MTELLENLTIHPEHAPHGGSSEDLLSHVLAQIRLTGDRVLARPLPEADELSLAAGEAHVLIVTAGSLRIEEDHQPAAVIDKGDLVLLPRGRGDLRLVAEGPDVVIVVCRFWFDRGSLRAMIEALPRYIHIRSAEAEGWIDGIAHFMMIEAGDVQPGAALMISRLIDLIVIRALRTWVKRGQVAGWLGALADARIARALKSVHEKPMQRWSNSELARLAGMSRSSFCERFTALVGRSPLRYQNEWRLGLARDMLARRDARVGEIGLRIGYASEAAFSRAYKDLFGHSPRAEFGAQDRAGQG